MHRVNKQDITRKDHGIRKKGRSCSKPEKERKVEEPWWISSWEQQLQTGRAEQNQGQRKRKREVQLNEVGTFTMRKGRRSV